MEQDLSTIWEVSEDEINFEVDPTTLDQPTNPVAGEPSSPSIPITTRHPNLPAPEDEQDESGNQAAQAALQQTDNTDQILDDNASSLADSDVLGPGDNPPADRDFWLSWVRYHAQPRVCPEGDLTSELSFGDVSWATSTSSWELDSRLSHQLTEGEKPEEKKSNYPDVEPTPTSRAIARQIVGTGDTMNKDASYTYVHFHRSSHADLLDEFRKDSRLPDDDIYVPPHLQPVNPEDEDDVVPDQHAAFGIQKATQKVKEPAWRDLGLQELMAHGPGGSNANTGPWGSNNRPGTSSAGAAGGAVPGNAAPRRRPGHRAPGSRYQGLPR
ncbi:Apc13p protein-domain-containing protein [Triangularia setosa]|uniref:Apc13p protein-domain-containing protein n=1 Tax=Triangularia setosa TaxID=2587417 RepID=A0AAN6W902_9PEZI|nr:Apc13p protein-domain-containing protein [Podospora setosa]